jgi:hypothetical protein
MNLIRKSWEQSSNKVELFSEIRPWFTQRYWRCAVIFDLKAVKSPWSYMHKSFLNINLDVPLMILSVLSCVQSRCTSDDTICFPMCVSTIWKYRKSRNIDKDMQNFGFIVSNKNDLAYVVQCSFFAERGSAQINFTFVYLCLIRQECFNSAKEECSLGQRTLFLCQLCHVVIPIWLCP